MKKRYKIVRFFKQEGKHPETISASLLTLEEAKRHLIMAANILNGIDWWSPVNPDATFRVLGVAQLLPSVQYFSRDFIRLQDISLSYDFNPTLVQNVGIKGLKVYVSGKNLITITDWLGWDPETGMGLETTSHMPVMKSITAGLDITF